MMQVNDRWKTGASRLALVLLALVLVVGLPMAMVWWQDPPVAAAPGTLLWRNALPLILLTALLYGLAGRLAFTAVASFGIALMLFEVNRLKELNMNEPLLPGDLVLRHQLAHNLGFFAHYLGNSLLYVGLTCLALAMLALLWWIERRHRIGAVPRIALVLVALLALITLFRGDGPWKVAYSDQHMPYFPLWEPIEGVRKDGLLAALVRITQESQVTIPKADLPVVTRFAASHAGGIAQRDSRTPPRELPDIVVVQSEAFFEPGVLKEVEFGEYVPNFARLMARGISGALVTPAYGGGTIRTEFETLTGYPILAFPAVTYPYYGLVGGWMPSVPRRLARFGYDTRLFHPFKGGFWNRREVIPQLGFKDAVYEEGFKRAEHAGFYVSDEALLDRVMASLDRHRGTPQFDFAITMENHGPWESDIGDFGKIMEHLPMPEGLSEDGRREFVHYFAHLVNGDRALGRFAERLLARPRWTVLLFYGDHLPVLPHAFPELGFDDNAPAPSQHTRYMLLSNRPLDARTLNLHSYDLPGLLFDTLGFPMDGYLAIEAEARLVAGGDIASPTVQNVVFNAARSELACRAPISREGTCSRHVRESGGSNAGE